MKPLVVITLLFAGIVPVAQARNPLARVGRFVAHHKEAVAQVAIVALASYADAASTVNAERNGAIETNPLLGRHPSTAATWGYAQLPVFGIVAVEWGVHTLTKDPMAYHALWVPTVGVALNGAMAAYQNTCAAAGSSR